MGGVMSQKREMPENIRKMFEQRKLASNNALNTQNSDTIQQHQESEETSTITVDENSGQNPVEPVELDNSLETSNNESNTNINAINNEQREKKSKLPKESEKKREKEKPQKEKKQLSKKSKIIIIVASVVFALAVAIVLIVTLCIPKTEKMQAPTLKVYSLSNEVMIYVDENDNADYYEFYIQKTGSSAQIIRNSSNNFIYIKEMLNNKDDASSLGEYTIWARYGSKNEKADSDISNKETVTYTKQLDKINDATLNLETNELTFSRVNNAISYRIYYGAGENEFITQVNPTSSSIDVITVNLANKLKAGNYNLMIQAIASTGENSYYTNSELSKSIEFIYKTKLEPIKTATFKKSTSNIKITLDKNKTNTSKFKIIINFSTASSPLTVEKEFDSIADSQVLDLSQILSKYSKTASEIASISVIAVGSGYIEDSTAISATIND